MIEFDDLLAARILSKQDPTLRGALLIMLADLRDGVLTQGLLPTLLVREVVTPEEGVRVRQLMDRYKRGRALGIFTHLLSEHLERSVIEDHARALGPQANVAQLAVDLVSRGLVIKEQVVQGQFRARLLFDRDLQRQLDEHLAAHPGSPGGHAPGAMESGRFNQLANLPNVGSAVFRLDVIVPTPSDEEAEEIVESGSSSFDDLLRPPSFEIPSWIDTAAIAGGKLMIGEHRLLGKIGEGLAATVFLGSALGDGDRPVAIKLLPKEASVERRARLDLEVQALKRIQHPGVPELYTAGVEDGQAFLAQAFFEGRPLAKVLEEHTTPIAPGRALGIARQVAEALGAIHAAKVQHGSVDGSTVLVSEDLSQARLTDFGAAKLDGSCVPRDDLQALAALLQLMLGDMPDHDSLRVWVQSIGGERGPASAGEVLEGLVRFGVPST